MKRFYKLVSLILIILLSLSLSSCDFIFDLINGGYSTINSSETTTTEEKPSVHSHSYDKKVIDDAYLKNSADCEHKAVYYYSCACGEKGATTFEYGEITEHQYGEYTIKTQASCVTNEIQVRTCSVCGAEEEKEIEGTKTAHQYYQVIVKVEYLKSEATCLSPAIYYKSCTCGKKGPTTFEYGETLPHNYSAYISDNNATHLQDGTKTRTCSTCLHSETVTDEGSKIAEHTFNLKVETDEYLATEQVGLIKATYYYSCECGAHGNTTFEASTLEEHIYNVADHSSKYLATAASCTKKATYYYSCLMCGEAGTETFEYGDYLPHEYTCKVENAEYKVCNADCQHKLTYYYSCSCGATGTSTFTVGSYGNHKYGTLTNYRSADHDHNATQIHTCSLCGDKEIVDVPDTMIAHNFNLKVSLDEYLAQGTACTNTAKYYYSCSCGAHNNQTYNYVVQTTYNVSDYYNGYYNNLVSWTDSEDLIEQLHDIISSGTYNPLAYEGNWESNKAADQALDDFEMYDAVYSTNNIIKTATSSQVNREHAFCASLMTGTGTTTAVNVLGRATDFLNLFASGTSGNTSRGNKCYGVANKSSQGYQAFKTGDVIDYSYDSTYFEPGDIDKGRLARAIFYMCVMYNEEVPNVSYKIEYKTGMDLSVYTSTTWTSSTKSGSDITVTYNMGALGVQNGSVTYTQGNSCEYKIGDLSALLNWATTYDVDRLEYQHNQSVYSYVYNKKSQGNRNPFVDYPELIEYAFGSKKNQSGSLNTLKPSCESLEINKNQIANYAIKTAPRRIDENSIINYSDFEIVSVKRDYSYSPYYNFTIEDSNGNLIKDGSEITLVGDQVLYIVTPLNRIKLNILIQTDVFEASEYSYSLPGNNTEPMKNKVANTDYTINMGGENWSFKFESASFTTSTGTKYASIGSLDKVYGCQFGSSSQYATKLTFTSVNEFNNIKGIYFEGIGSSGNSITLNVYVDNQLVKTKVIERPKGTLIPEIVSVEFDEPISGKVMYEILNSAKGAFYVKNIAIDY